jgi:prevent-host-death family protein
VFVLDSNRKGAIAEAEIYAAAVRLGIAVYLPATDHSCVDMVFMTDGRPWRIQCKWGSLSEDRAFIVVHTGTSRLTPAGYVRTTYRPDEIDAIGVYCAAIDRCFLVPALVACGRMQIRLRMTPPRNRQRACINIADEFDFEGAVAQLGERRHGMAEVRGSSPLSSTPPMPTGPTVVGVNPFRDKLGYWVDRVAAGEEVIVTRHGRPRIRCSPATPAA